MSFSKVVSFLLIVVLLVFFLSTRLYKIGEIPPSVYWDEASIGYNAYSILTSGKDEWGRSFPLHFYAFGEYKLPIYIYSALPFVAVFGLSEFSVRVPAVLFGALSLSLLWAISLRIFKDRMLAFLSGLLFVTLPGYFVISRIGYEANAGLSFVLAGTYLFLLSFEKPKLLLLSALALALAVYSYNAFRVLVPGMTVLALVYMVFYEKVFLRKHLWLVVSSIGILALAFVFVVRLYASSGFGRFEAIGVFEGEGSILGVVFNNTLKYLNFGYLFLSGDVNIRHQVHGYGILYIWQSLLVVFGVLYIVLNYKKPWWILIVLLLLSIVPAVITKEAPHNLRSIGIFALVPLVMTLGVVEMTVLLRQKTVVSVVIIMVVVVSFGVMFLSFLQRYSLEAEGSFQHPYKQLVVGYSGEFGNYQKVLITDVFVQPYIFLLFYQEYSPEEFRKSVSYNDYSRWGRSIVDSFGNLKFIDEDVPFEVDEDNLVVLSKPSTRADLRLLETIPNRGGQLYVYER